MAPVAAHPTIAESLPEPPGPGAVVLDIGGDMGGAVVYAPEALAGSEIEIRRAGALWDGRHVAVRERRLPGGPCWAALFPALPQGDYEARLKGDPSSPVLLVSVEGGRVASVDWHAAG